MTLRTFPRRKRILELLTDVVVTARVVSAEAAHEEPLAELVPPVHDSDHVAARLAALILGDAAQKNALEVNVEPRANELVVSYVSAGDSVVAALTPPKKLAPWLCDVLRATRALKIGRSEIDVDTVVNPSRFGHRVSVALFRRPPAAPAPLPADWCAPDARPPLPQFASAARVEPCEPSCEPSCEPTGEPTGVVWLRAESWRPTWTYPMSRHHDLVAAVRRRARDDEELTIHEDACAAGVRLFLRKRS